MTKSSKEQNKFENLIAKSTVKQLAYKNVFEAFNLLKAVLKELVEEYHDALKGKVDDDVLPVFMEKGVFEAEFKIGGDLLIFSMHSNIFVFDREHPIWKTEYVKANGANSYCGVINIYNFLSDSFKYNRLDDLGYLIARIFINWENHFFVQGKRQSDEVVKDFVKDTVHKEILRKIIETSIQYAIDFDLLVPPYDNVKIASVEQMMVEISHSKIQTGKRLGFKFNSDDV
ncbi:MAG: hypothetical protein A2W90_03925 [Bacteroidetes bacterium GWF2_42_66]|nr:MAG: hypothetical protein A2W92_06510 [Bacteroidetes bacterium GWA2_42_15]OFY02526.1 MAG: hypothetical protein A2W89_21930 [Bacteroidetes bacterium GWE2_42_39]OFY41376.1 MAG: hypothetical protein A2W90_03925 [Bacteroidetes bacterium GWF2_42_66]HBL75424.1 hypothetical protein [Prolixibacteraceae bacterium]HCR91310.1 hypothetical protein [Prolixibacteraceae bacterium]